MVKTNTSELVLPHVLGLFFGFVGPLIVFLVAEKKKMKDHAREALNWQLSVLLYGVIVLPLVFIFVGIPLLVLIYILAIIFPIIASVKAAEGAFYKYPVTIRFLK